jgi:hypothetical protein
MVGFVRGTPYYNNFNYNTYYILNGNSTTIIYILAHLTEFLEKPNSIP